MRAPIAFSWDIVCYACNFTDWQILLGPCRFEIWQRNSRIGHLFSATWKWFQHWTQHKKGFYSRLSVYSKFKKFITVHSWLNILPTFTMYSERLHSYTNNISLSLSRSLSFLLFLAFVLSVSLLFFFQFFSFVLSFWRSFLLTFFLSFCFLTSFLLLNISFLLFLDLFFSAHYLLGLWVSSIDSNSNLNNILS